MIKKIINKTKKIEKNIYRIMKLGYYFSFVICLISLFISFTYILNPISHLLYVSGIILFKTGLTFGIMFFISGFTIDTIKKEIL